LDGLLAYSTRHFARVERLLRSTRLLDYSLVSMKVCARVASHTSTCILKMWLLSRVHSGHIR
jgi:hypothetical protein